MYMTQNEFATKKESILKPLAEAYGLRYCPLDDDVALVGKDFAIIFYFGRGETDIVYWLFNGNEMIEYPFDSFIVSTGNDQDREGVEFKDGLYEHNLSDLQVLVNILQNHWQEILKGNRAWLELYQQSEDGYTPEKVHNQYSEIVRRVILQGQLIKENGYKVQLD